MANKRKGKKFRNKVASADHRHSPQTHPITLDLKISDLSRSGSGVGRDEVGRAVFVPFTAPGDVVRVRLLKQKRQFAEATVLEIIDASPLRITPRCDVFSQCGGCQWQHIPYELQWQTKLNGVRESLRLAKIEVPPVWEEFPAQQIWGYRNRIQLRGKAGALGFFARQSNTLVPIQRCEIAQPALNQALAAKRQEALQFNKPYKLELSLTQDGAVQSSWNQVHAADGFRQVNDEQNAKLQAWIVAVVDTLGRKHLYDLYGGSGNLSLPLVNRMQEIHCIDLSINIPETERQQLPDYFHFHPAKVLPWLQQSVKEKQRPSVKPDHQPWLAICDPPRAGLGNEAREVMGALEHLNVDSVIFVGCKADSWSRDLAQFIAQGWALRQVAVFDFFPQTAHVESVALLQRGE